MKDRKIDERMVQHVALLSRLSLSDEEVKSFSGQLSIILEYIEKLDELNTKDTELTSHAGSSMQNVFREDEIKKSLPVEGVLKNAPEKIKNFFAVPKILEL